MLKAADVKVGDLGASARALGAAWRRLSVEERKPYEAMAALDRSKREVELLRGAQLKDPKQFETIAATVRRAVEHLKATHAPLQLAMLEVRDWVKLSLTRLCSICLKDLKSNM